MGDIILTAVACYQRKELMLVGAISGKDLIKIYEIDLWKKGKRPEEQGYQRPPIKSHYQRIGRKLKRDSRAKLPTSITLSANIKHDNPNKNTINIEFEKHLNIVRIRIPEGNKVKVTDGQHRILGLDFALQVLEAEDLDNFQLPFVMMLPESRIDEIRTFYEINTEGKKVSTDLALQLLNDWNNNTAGSKVTKAERLKLVALNIAMNMNEDSGSVWHNVIYTGNTSRKQGIISSTAFVSSLRPLLNNISFVKKEWEQNNDIVDAAKKITPLVNNFWNGLKMVIPDFFPSELDEKKEWYIQKNVGAQVWHMVAPFIIEECLVRRQQITDLTEENIGNFIKKYAGYGIDDADIVWEARGRGEVGEASSTKAYNSIASTIINDIEENFIGESEKELSIRY